MLGFTNGSKEPPRVLPVIMAAEWPAEWAATKFREWHTGHYHKKKQTHYNACDTFVGVIVRTIQSLTATDAWHYGEGYINNVRAAEGFLYSYTDGPVGEFLSVVRECA